MTPWIGVLIVGVGMSTNARAYDRMRQPVAVAIAMSDAVVVGKVTQVERVTRPLSTVTVQVERSLLGDLSGSIEVEVDHGWQAGDRVIVHLTRVRGAYKAVLDGTATHTPELEAERVTQLKAKPGWSAPVGGLSTALAIEKPQYAPKDEINAYVVYRNVSEGPLTLKNREWPLDEHTRVELVVTRDGEPVPSVPHPHVTKKDIDDYFSKHGNHFEIELAPGESFAWGLQRINSAEPGWGYKERQGFRYWPMDAVGTYTVVAKDVLRGMVSPAVTVEVK